jgi:rhodanese-related sulfurtransferase
LHKSLSNKPCGKSQSLRGERVRVSGLRTSSGVVNVPAQSAWEGLSAHPKSQLIDVRTQAEWTFVGVADLDAIGRQTILVEWLRYPDNRLNDGFVSECRAQLESHGANTETSLYFICRSGARSLSAASAMYSAGYTFCYNIAEGFEGPLDTRRRRGIRGWKADGLPWIQG